MTIRLIGALLAALLSLGVPSAWAGSLQLLKDINRSVGVAYDGGPVAFGGSTLIGLCSDDIGCALWAGDGTEAGTALVKALPDGVPSNFTPAGDKLFFASGQSFGRIWVTDGTAVGTYEAPMPPGAIHRVDQFRLAVLAGTAYFTDGNKIWKTDGTAGGSGLVTDQGSNPVTAAGVVFFLGETQASGTELWRTDGTPGGTYMVADLTPGDGSSLLLKLTGVGDRLLFQKCDTLSGPCQLWASDGTGPGTVALQPTAASIELFASGSTAYLIDYSSPAAIWRTDGTPAGTTYLGDVPASMYGSAASGVFAGSLFYFCPDIHSSNPEIWRTDGTPAGTLKLSDASFPVKGMAANGTALYFTKGPSSSRSLWRTQGTPETTEVVLPQSTLIPRGSLGAMLALQSDSYGAALWVSDGSESGTHLFEVAPGQPSNDSMICDTKSAVAGGLAYFAAHDELHGCELWKSDGTAAGTVLVKDIEPGPKRGVALWSEFVPLGNEVFFFAGEFTPYALWKSDGTDAGTVRIATLGVSAASLVAAGSKLFFTANNFLWTSDRTEAGTQMVPGAPYSPSPPVAMGDVVVFTAFAGTGQELWRSDGTAAGTFRVLSIPALGELTSAGTQVFFWGSDAAGAELWRTDGTLAGTRRVVDANPGPGDGIFAHAFLGALGNRIVYNRFVGPTSMIAISDGTAEGTVALTSGVLADTYYDSKSVVLDGRMYFWATDGVRVTDGTAAGTRVVNGLDTFCCQSQFASAHGTLYITGGPQLLKEKLWMSSGTTQSTTLIDEIPGGSLRFSRDQRIQAHEVPAGLLIFAGGMGPGLEPQVVASDTAPNAIVISSIGNVLSNQVVRSTGVQVWGFNVPQAASASGGEICVSSTSACACDLAPFGPSALIGTGEFLCVRHIAAQGALATATTNISVGPVNTSFSSMTSAANPPTLTFDGTTATVLEGGTTTLQVLRLGSSQGALSASWITFDETAAAGTDFGVAGVPGAVSGTLTWADGDFSPKAIVVGGSSAAIALIDDAAIEAAKTFRVYIYLVPAGTAVLQGTVTVTIADDDSRVQFADTTVITGETGAPTQLQIVRTGRLDIPASVNWSTAHFDPIAGAYNPAVPGADYGTTGSPAEVSGTANFAPGQAIVNLSVGPGGQIPILNDGVAEPREAFLVVLSLPGDGLALGTIAQVQVIIESNGTPGITLSPSTYNVREGEPVNVWAHRVGDPSQPISANFATVNGTAIAGTNYEATGGVVSWLAGSAAPLQIAVHTIRRAGVASGLPTFQLALSSPVGGALVAPSTATITLSEEDGVIQFSASQATMTEGTPLNVTVTRNGVTAYPVSIGWTAVNLFGSAPVVFTSPTSGTLTWAGNDVASKTIQLQVAGDPGSLPPRFFQVTLGNPDHGKLGANSAVLVTLKDSNAGFAFGGATSEMNEGAAPSVLVEVHRTGPATGTASVRWTTANGTAVAGQDFGTPRNSAQLSGTLTWAAGESQPKQFYIPVLQDSASEGTESFTVSLSNPSAGMKLGSPSTLTVIIHDDDPVAKTGVRFVQPKILVIENAGTVSLNVERFDLGGGFASPASVNFATQPGTALAGPDYVARTGTLSWGAGDSSTKPIVITIVNDAVAESPESFKVLLSNPGSGLKVDSPSEATVTIIDDDDTFPKYGAVPNDWTVPAAANAGWHTTSEPGAYEGVYSLRSDAIDDGEVAQVEVTRVFVAGNVSFRVRISSEPNFDKLRFFVDAVEKGSWSGIATTGWTLFTTPLTAGSHTLRWSYEKDGSASVGQDAAWIDAVTLP